MLRNYSVPTEARRAYEKENGKERVAGIEDFSLKLIVNFRGCFRGIAPMTITRILCKLPQVLINLNSTSIIII